ncbi:MAG: hypothetical protein ACREIL_08130, partial [Nitrospiraceae bacterium]
KVRGELLRQFSEAIAIQRSVIPYGECPIDLLVVCRIDAIIPDVMLKVILRSLRVGGGRYGLTGQSAPHGIFRNTGTTGRKEKETNG